MKTNIDNIEVVQDLHAYRIGREIRPIDPRDVPKGEEFKPFLHAGWGFRPVEEGDFRNVVRYKGGIRILTGRMITNCTDDVQRKALEEHMRQSGVTLSSRSHFAPHLRIWDVGPNWASLAEQVKLSGLVSLMEMEMLEVIGGR